MTPKAFFIGAIIVGTIAILMVQQERMRQLQREFGRLREQHGETVSERNSLSISRPQTKDSIQEPEKAKGRVWEAVEADDYGTYIANLRAIGCPEQTVRDIIIADLDRTHAARVAQLTVAQKEREPYWRVPNYNASVQYRRELTRIEDEKRTAARDLLGIDLDEEMSLRKTGIDQYESEFGYLPPEKRSQIVERRRRHDSLGRELAIKRDKGLLSEDQYNAQLRQLYETREADVTSLLAPGEVTEYQIRQSDVSFTLRKQLEALEPSEEEFRRIFAIESQFSARQPIGGKIDPLIQTQRQEALRAALGEQRYAEYQKALSFDYFTLYKIAEEFNLPRAVADSVYQLQPQAEAEANRIRNDASLAPDAKAAGLKALREETEMQMARQLGETGYNRYLSRAHFWLSRISP